MRSVFLRRMLVVLIGATLLAFLSMSGGYLLLSKNVYSGIKLGEMLPKAEALGQLLVEHTAGNLSDEGFSRMSQKLMYAADVAVCFTLADGRVSYLYDETESIAAETVQQALAEQIPQVLSGQPVQTDDLTLAGQNMLAVGAPVTAADGTVLGSVFVLKSNEAVTSALLRLNSALFLCGVGAALVIMMVSALGMRRMTGPLQEMSEVAIRMSKGDFDARADEREPGEVGLLARALNNLCDNLSNTIFQLCSEKSQLNELLSSLTDGVAALDSTGALTHYNPALMKMFGAVKVQTRSDLIGDSVIWDAFDQVYMAGEGRTLTYHMPGERTLWITISPVTAEDGVCTGVVGLFKDMTELERLEALRREYIANVSHELRSPLTAVRGLLEPLADGMVREEEDRQRYYRIMLHEVMRLSRLITDMLTLSRLQAGKEYVELTRVDVDELITDLVQGYKAEAAKKGVTLRADAPNMPDALTDPDRVEQVLVILLDNALRYTPEGGTVTIRVREGERLLVSVEDTGCGIPERDLPYVFERFYKVDKSRKEGGTGLGLSIAKQMVEKLGETIRVESVEGQGACFTFTLKKYNPNIIALGPAHEEWAEPARWPADARQEPTALAPKHLVQDAHYEIIEEAVPTKPRRGKEESRAREDGK